MSDRKPLWVARLAGTQAEMGAQHGRLAAHDAAALFDFYRTMPERMLAGDLGAGARLAVRGIANAWAARLARERPRDFAARTRAFVDAVRETVPRGARSAALAIATMDAMQNCVALAARLGAGPFGGGARSALGARVAAAAVPACSTAIAWGRATADGELWFARNFDFPGAGVWDVAPAFVACEPTGGQPYGFFATRGADTAVVTVVNEAGLAIAPHTRWHRDVAFGGAMIVDVVHAIAARAETIADALAIAREHPASSSWGIAIGSARERTAAVLELAGPHVELVRPAPGAETLVCTNHYRAPALIAGELAASHAWVAHTERRAARLEALIAGRALTPRDLVRALGDRIDPRDPDQRVRRLGATLAQPVNVHCVAVAPALRRALVGVDAAPACEGAFVDLAWDWRGPLGGWDAGALDIGVRATPAPDVAAPHDDATRAVYAAVCAYESSHDVPAARAGLDRAIAAAPGDPSLRLGAAWLALEAGDARAALAHARAGLADEREAYRRGQLLLWGARAADRARDPGTAARLRAELDRLDGDGVAELRARCHRPLRGKPHVNLLMMDCF